MAELVYRTSLREANITRQAEWDTGGNIDLAYAGNEFAGEVSEAIAEAVLLIENGIVGNDIDSADIRASVNYQISRLADELGDVVICIDLIGLRVNLDPIVIAHNEFRGTIGPQEWVNQLGADLQHVCNTIKKLERARHGMPGSRASLDDLHNGLWDVAMDTAMLASCYNIDLGAVVAAKFNKTSEKVGLKTRYAMDVAA